MSKEIHEYRCTRNFMYEPGCIGHPDVRARQGHYVSASSPVEAAADMLSTYPHEILHGFSIQEFDGGTGGRCWIWTFHDGIQEVEKNGGEGLTASYELAEKLYEENLIKAMVEFLRTEK